MRLEPDKQLGYIFFARVAGEEIGTTPKLTHNFFKQPTAPRTYAPYAALPHACGIIHSACILGWLLKGEAATRKRLRLLTPNITSKKAGVGEGGGIWLVK